MKYIAIRVFRLPQTCVSIGLQRYHKGKAVVFTTTLIAWSEFNPNPGHVIASLMRCFIMIISAQWLWKSRELNGQDFEDIRSNIGSLHGDSYVAADSFKHEVVSYRNKKCITIIYATASNYCYIFEYFYLTFLQVRCMAYV